MTRLCPPLHRRFVASFASMALLTVTAHSSANAQSTPGSGSTRTVVLNALSVVNSGDLDFGTLIAGSTAGTVTIAPANGARSVTGGTVAAGGTPQAATFLTTGVINRLYLISLPSTATTLTNGSGATMTVNNFAHDAGFLPRITSGGVATVHVGARLNVGANQPDGNYTGTFMITIIYL